MCSDSLKFHFFLFSPGEEGERTQKFISEAGSAAAAAAAAVAVGQAEPPPASALCPNALAKHIPLQPPRSCEQPQHHPGTMLHECSCRRHTRCHTSQREHTGDAKLLQTLWGVLGLTLQVFRSNPTSSGVPPQPFPFLPLTTPAFPPQLWPLPWDNPLHTSRE